MQLNEAKDILKNAGYLVEATEYGHDSQIDLSKLNSKLKEMEQDLQLFHRIGSMIVAYLDRVHRLKSKCVADEDDDEHKWYIKIITDTRSDIKFEISISDYNEKLIWISYDIFGKKGGIEAQYSNDKYADLMKTKGSYINVIDNLIKEEK